MRQFNPNSSPLIKLAELKNKRQEETITSLITEDGLVYRFTQNHIKPTNV